MELHGSNLIASDPHGNGSETYRATDANTGEPLSPEFTDATPEELDRAMAQARTAYDHLRTGPAEAKAALLDRIADEIEALGDQLVERVHAETALSEGRIRGERDRTTGQLRMFAEVVRDGSWVDARIDTPNDNFPAIRRMLMPIGPVAVFGASNFPLAFSVAGGDTASALAAGCPVVYKVHPGHPGTSELVGRAITAAVEACDLPPGTFSLIHGHQTEVGVRLVEHPDTEAVGFTGSLPAGRAIFDAATSREEPIPVYAEMGSVNPQFVLPGALEERGDEIAEGLTNSVTMGTGQFCTNPGLVFGLEGPEMASFSQATASHLQDTSPSHMLHEGIRSGFEQGVDRVRETDGVEVLAEVSADADGAGTLAGAVAFETDSDHLSRHEHLLEEVFGPSTVLVNACSADDLVDLARDLEGNLSASIHGTEADLQEHDELVRVLEKKVGRLIFNGFPTGVRVCHAMHHGGPYPATTDVRSTSVGTAAIERFARPVCYQGFPDSMLPPELKDENERDIWRMIDGEQTKADVQLSE